MSDSQAQADEVLRDQIRAMRQMASSIVSLADGLLKMMHPQETPVKQPPRTYGDE